MKLYKIILFFLGFNDVYSQICNNDNYYCSSLKKCLTKGVICKKRDVTHGGQPENTTLAG